jgi:hypothetical protein
MDSGYTTYLAQAKHHSYAVVLTEQEWLAAQNPEPMTDKGPQWGTWGDHTAGHEHATRVRPVEMRKMFRTMKRDDPAATHEQLLARLNALAMQDAEAWGVEPMLYTLFEVEAALKESNAGKGTGEPLGQAYADTVSKHAHAPRAGDRQRRAARRDAKFAERDEI